MRKRRLRRAKRVAIIKKFTLFTFLYLILFTAHFTMITLSKFIGSSTGQGNSNIAKWGVEIDTTDNESDSINIIAGNGSQSYTLKLTSTSETKALYSIKLSDVPSDLQVKLDNGDYQTPNNNKITFSDVGYINSNAETRTITHTLTFNFPIDSSVVEQSEINIDVIFNQVNPTNN